MGCIGNSKMHHPLFRLVVMVLLLFTLVQRHHVQVEAKSSRKKTWGGGNSLMQREEEIYFWENEIKALREGELLPAINELARSGAALQNAKKNGGFFPNAETRKVIKVLDEEYNSRLRALAEVRAEEESMLANLKPLYGVLSIPFAQDQKDQIAKSITYVKDATYQSALWDSIFDLGNTESFSDIIINFFVRWLTTFMLVYPFAILYYALWALPWSIYAYSSGIFSFIPGVVVYFLSVFAISLPFIALAGGLFLVVKNQKQNIHYHRD